MKKLYSIKITKYQKQKSTKYSLYPNKIIAVKMMIEQQLLTKLKASRALKQQYYRKSCLVGPSLRGILLAMAGGVVSHSLFRFNVAMGFLIGECEDIVCLDGAL